MSNKNQTLMTPFGKAIWPYLTKTDNAFRSSGVYKVDLEVPVNDESNALHATLEKALESAGPAGKRRHRSPMQLNEEGTAYIIKMSMNAHVVNKAKGIDFMQKPRIYDGAAQPWKPEIEITSGSILRCTFVVSPFNMDRVGITLRLSDVQVKQLGEPEAPEAPNPFDSVWSEDQQEEFNRGSRGRAQHTTEEPSEDQEAYCDDDFAALFDDEEDDI